LGVTAAGGALVAFNLADFGHTEHDVEGVGAHGAELIGNGGGTVVVIDDINALGAVVVFAENAATLIVVAPTGKAGASFVDNAGQVVG